MQVDQPPQLTDAVPVYDLERKAKLGLQLILPLYRHRRRRSDHDEVHPAPEQELTCDQARFDRLAEADIVRNQQVDARQTQRFAQREKLVGIEPDPRAEWRLKQVTVSGCRGSPSNCPDVRRQDVGAVGMTDANASPFILVENSLTNLSIP